MKTILPSKNDLLDLRHFTQIMPNAISSVMGQTYKSSIDPRMLWLLIKINSEKSANLWEYAGIKTEGENNSFRDMLEATEHFVHVSLYKYKISLFKSIWIGNIDLQFSGYQVFLGTVGGKHQHELWKQFKDFFELKLPCYDGTAQAICSLTLNEPEC